MKWLEIIELRAGRYDRKTLEKDLKRLCHDLKKDPNQPKFKIYENRNIDSDLSIHLLHSTIMPDLNQSPLGCQIATILKTFGLVSHTIWRERNANKEKSINSKENE